LTRRNSHNALVRSFGSFLKVLVSAIFSPCSRETRPSNGSSWIALSAPYAWSQHPASATLGCIEIQIFASSLTKSRNTSSSFALGRTSPMPVSSRAHGSSESHSSPSQLSRPWSASGNKSTSRPLLQSITSAASGLSTPVKYQNTLSWRNCM
jgi:hypothetical protein